MTNIAEILRDYPKGTKLYSPMCGEVSLICATLKTNTVGHEIKAARLFSDGDIVEYYFLADGRVSCAYDAECMLFPSKENRDWETMRKKEKQEFQPFQKVLGRNDNSYTWCAGIFSHKENGRYCCVGCSYSQCIPYEGNEHLLGTTKGVEKGVEL